MLIVAFSGGKDSTALALRLAERGHLFRLLHTATGNELPQVRTHIEAVAKATDSELIDLNAPTLSELIDEQGCLPNWRMRWCTRMIKIEPCAQWLSTHPDAVLAVGLRSDEEGRAGGIYEGNKIVYPLRDWKWGIDDVIGYCRSKGFEPPKRTDCAVCFYQTLHEWWELLTYYPDEYVKGEEWEHQTGYTFRSPGRDTWPAALKDMRAEFESGRVPKQRRRKTACRLCSM